MHVGIAGCRTGGMSNWRDVGMGVATREPHGVMIKCVTDYHSHKKSVVLPNNKSWITSDLKKLLNKKKKVFRKVYRKFIEECKERVRKRKQTCETRD